MSHPRRLAWVYLVGFGVLGAFAPFLTLQLRDQGLTGRGLLLALVAAPVGRLVAGPAWGWAADRLQAPRLLLMLATTLSVLGAVALTWGTGGWLLLAAFVFSVGRAPVNPLVDALTLRSLGPHPERYGLLRRWGSVGFMLVALGAGAAWETFSLRPFVVLTALSVALLVSVTQLPGEDKFEPVSLGPALRVLFTDRPLAWVLMASALHFAAIYAYDLNVGVRFRELGHAQSWVGAAVAWGVFCELVVLSAGARLLHRWGPERVFALAVAVSVPRWVLTAWFTDPLALAVVQGLHGLGFGGFWLAGIALVHARTPERVANSGQALFGAAVGGVGAALGAGYGAWAVDTWGTAGMFQGNVLLTLGAGLCLWRGNRSP